jgi:predicted ATP-grasp superfamily ATP-dependent carboligase
LGLVRSLAARGTPVAVITTKPYDIAHRSRWVCAHHAILDLDDEPDHLLALLEQQASAWAGWAIFPTNDGAVAALVKHWDRLSATYRIIAPAPDIAPYLLNKEQMLGIARAVGVDMPHCYGPANETTAARNDLHFPVVVKPVIGYRFFARFGCKLFVAADHAELRHCLARLADAGLNAQIFDLVPGPDSEIYAHCTYIDASGEASGGLTIRKLRQSPPFFGVARAARIVADPSQLREITLAMLRRIGFRGMASAEFKRDARDGRFYFLEINGRSVIYNGLLRRGGLDFAALAWADYVDAQPARVQPSGWSGTWVNLHADLLYSLLHRRDAPVSLGELAGTYAGVTIEALWSARDPLPFVTQWARTGRDGIAAVWRGQHREILADRHTPAASSYTLRTRASTTE